MADTGATSWPATDNLDLPTDKTIAPTSAGDGHYVFIELLRRLVGVCRAIWSDLTQGFGRDFNMGGHKVTNMVDGAAATDAATWGQVQALLNGLDWTHPAVRAVATSNIALTGTPTIDGVVLVAGDRVLAAGQTTGSQNGLYVVASGAWARAADADTSAEVPPGLAVVVTEGTANGDTVWILTTNAPIVLGTTALTFQELPTPNALLAGAGLTRTGNTINAIANADGSIVVNADDIGVAAGGITLAKLASALVDAILPWRVDINPITATAVSQVNWSTISQNAATVSKIVVTNGTVNAEINFDVVLAAGTWDFRFLTTHFNDAGIITVQLDGTTLGTIDLFVGANAWDVRDAINAVVVATTGKKRLRLLMAAKNAGSASYYGYLAGITLQRTA